MELFRKGIRKNLLLRVHAIAHSSNAVRDATWVQEFEGAKLIW